MPRIQSATVSLPTCTCRNGEDIPSQRQSKQLYGPRRNLPSHVYLLFGERNYKMEQDSSFHPHRSRFLWCWGNLSHTCRFQQCAKSWEVTPAISSKTVRFYRHFMEASDRTLRKIMQGKTPYLKPLFLFAGELSQVLLFVRSGSRVQNDNECVK